MLRLAFAFGTATLVAVYVLPSLMALGPLPAAVGLMAAAAAYVPSVKIAHAI